MAKVKFEDFTATVQGVMDDTIYTVLEECAGELESQTKRNTAVDTGKTKNSWRHKVGQTGTEFSATVGSDYENAIWEEFGTGEYALNGDGRKGGWAYIDPKTGDRIWTRGKHPRRAFWNAYTALKNAIIKRIQDALKGGLS